jgi:hypothetical protein
MSVRYFCGLPGSFTATEQVGSRTSTVDHQPVWRKDGVKDL